MEDANAKRECGRAEPKASPQTDQIERVEKLHGLDRSGLGEKGWAEVPEDRIGGHPELETAPSPDGTGGLNGPQPETDLATGAAKTTDPTNVK